MQAIRSNAGFIITASTVIFIAGAAIANAFGFPILETVSVCIVAITLVYLQYYGNRFVKVCIAFFGIATIVVSAIYAVWRWFDAWISSWPKPDALTGTQVTGVSWGISISVMLLLIAIGNFAATKWRWGSAFVTACAAGIGALILGSVEYYAIAGGAVFVGVFLFRILLGSAGSKAETLSDNRKFAVMGIINAFGSLIVNNIAAYAAVLFGNTPERVLCIIAGGMVALMFIPE